jgi:GAF domain
MKTRRRKPTTAKHRKQPATVRNRGSSAADLQKQLDQRTCELAEAQKHLAEALEQQTATSEVLQIISSSSGELEPVFQAMLSNATSICKAKFGTLWLCEGDAFRAVALHNAPPAYAEARRREFRLRPPPNTALGRVASTKQVVHVADIRTHSYDPDWLAPAALAKYRTVVSVPMLKDNELIGAINTDISQIESRSAAQSGKVDGRRLPDLRLNEYVDSGQALDTDCP